MSEFDKPPPYSPQAPAPTTTQPTLGYQAGPYIPPASQVHGDGQQAWGYPVTQVNPNTMPAYGSTIYIQQPPPTSPQILLVGGCPACRVGVLEEDFTCLGVCMAIFFFPLGILCCLAMMQRRCPNCGAIFR